MFNSISWQEFIVGLSLLCSAYYLVIIIIFYRKEVVGFLTNRHAGIKGGGSTNKRTSGESKSSMMGTPKSEATRASELNTGTSDDELIYASSDDLPDEVMELGAATLPQDDFTEMISRLLEEIDSLSTEIVESKLDEQQAVALFEQLLSRHTQLINTPYRPAINEHLLAVTQPPFPVTFSREQVEKMWKQKN